MRATPLIAAFLTVFMLSSVIALADTPVKQVALQGRLSDPTGKPLDGTFSVKFEIFASAAEGASGTGLWSEAQRVTVTKGLFGVNLGTVTPLNLAFDKPYWVEVSIGAEKLTPRYPLTSAPYSFYGGVAGSITADNIIGTLNVNQIPALTAAQIPNLDAAKIVSGTLAAARIPVLTADKIPSLTSAWTGTIDATKIATGTLSADRIPKLDASKKIADYSITSFQIDHTKGLEAEILFSGTLNPARVPPLYSGWTGGRIDASFIGTGTSTNWVAGIPASMVTGALTAAQIPALPSTWTGTIDASRINGTLAAARIPIITGSMIGTKAVGTTNIADKGVTQDKLAKRYQADQADYTGHGMTKNLYYISPSASCACSVPDSAIYFCNCRLAAANPSTGNSADLYVTVTKRSDGSDAPIGTQVSWIAIERG